MAVPEGYTKLGLVGFVDKGNYSVDTTYLKGDVVFYNGSTYKVLKDNLRGVTPKNDGVNYRYMAQGFADASGLPATDTNNLTGVGAGKKSTVQAILDAITKRLVEKVVTSDSFQTVLGKYLVNNGLTTQTGKFALDAVFGKNLQDQITQQNSNIPIKAHTIQTTITDVFDIENKSGVYGTSQTTKNLPVAAYGKVIITKNSANAWIFVEFLPTDLSSIYFNFYNGYSSPPSWGKWKKLPLQTTV